MRLRWSLIERASSGSRLGQALVSVGSNVHFIGNTGQASHAHLMRRDSIAILIVWIIAVNIKSCHMDLLTCKRQVTTRNVKAERQETTGARQPKSGQFRARVAWLPPTLWLGCFVLSSLHWPPGVSSSWHTEQHYYCVSVSIAAAHFFKAISFLTSSPFRETSVARRRILKKAPQRNNCAIWRDVLSCFAADEHPECKNAWFRSRNKFALSVSGAVAEKSAWKSSWLLFGTNELFMQSMDKSNGNGWTYYGAATSTLLSTNVMLWNLIERN